jgi:hypothetical protein
MAKLPWHEVVRLREELKTGDLSLQMFGLVLHPLTRPRSSTARFPSHQC